MGYELPLNPGNFETELYNFDHDDKRISAGSRLTC